MTRGTGETTRQMEAAAKNAVFVWCNNALSYPQHVARQIGRQDLKIVGPDWLTSDRWHGLELADVVIDHATVLSEKERRYLQEVKTRVRSR